MVWYFFFTQKNRRKKLLIYYFILPSFLVLQKVLYFLLKNDFVFLFKTINKNNHNKRGLSKLIKWTNKNIFRPNIKCFTKVNFLLFTNCKNLQDRLRPWPDAQKLVFVIRQKIKPGIFSDRWQPMTIQFHSKDGIGYPMPNHLDSKVGVGHLCPRVPNAKPTR